MKILVVCHGNMNRSPACEAVLKAEGIKEVRSSGFKISTKCAAKKMRDAMKQRGYDLSDHVPVPITQGLVNWCHVIVFMDGGNLKRLESLFEPTRCLYALGRAIGINRIPDPGFMKRDSIEFEQTVDLIIEASKAFAEQVRKS